MWTYQCVAVCSRDLNYNATKRDSFVHCCGVLGVGEDGWTEVSGDLQGTDCCVESERCSLVTCLDAESVLDNVFLRQRNNNSHLTRVGIYVEVG